MGLALEHSFLLHAILSVSALHLATVEADQDWLVDSTLQMEAGLKEFRFLIATPDERLGPPLFAFACLLVVQNFGVAMVQEVADPIQEFLNCINLIRGVSTITTRMWDVVQHSDLAPILVSAAFDKSEPQIPSLTMLRHKIRHAAHGSSEAAEQRINALINGVDQLEYVANEAFSPEKTATALAILCTWPASIHETLVQLITDRDEYALASLAYFASILGKAGSLWWLSGWDDLLSNAIHPLLPTNLKEWLTEARSV